MIILRKLAGSCQVLITMLYLTHVSPAACSVSLILSLNSDSVHFIYIFF